MENDVYLYIYPNKCGYIKAIVAYIFFSNMVKFTIVE